VIQHLLLVAAIDSEARLHGFLKWPLIFITVLAALALLAANHIIECLVRKGCGWKELDKSANFPRRPSSGLTSLGRPFKLMAAPLG
jgi:hypothetical protein